jgi:alpha-glucosidase
MSSSSDWWRSAVIYQVYPRSFFDSSADGIGDLPGITAKLGYLAELGVDAVWISPFYSSPQADAGYDVSDYFDVDPIFGTLADFDELMQSAHALGLRVIVDLVPNHTSDEHPWFAEALGAAPGGAERARYMFREGRGEHGELPPNNWQSVFHGPAWTRVTEADGSRGQWYLHLFDTKQPDLDWSNPEVREEFDRVLRFWLERGVDGFRVDVARGLVKQDGLPDFPPEYQHAPGPGPDGVRSPVFDQDGVHEIYRGWRQVLENYRHDPVLVAEAHTRPPERLAAYVRADEMHQAFNFEYLDTPLDAAALRAVIAQSYDANHAVGASSTWVLNNHDDVRHVTRFGLPAGTYLEDGIGPRDAQPDVELGLRRGRAATAIMLALPGSAYIYQGEELGLPEHTTLEDDARQDPTWHRSGGTAVGRDGARVPIPWTASGPSYGFSESVTTWLPQPDDWERYAVESQVGVAGSTWELYRLALALRRYHGMGVADLEWLPVAPGFEGAVLAFRAGSVTVVANLSDTPYPWDPGTVLLASGELETQGVVPPWTTVWSR